MDYRFDASGGGSLRWMQLELLKQSGCYVSDLSRGIGIVRFERERESWYYVLQDCCGLLLIATRVFTSI